MKKQNLFDERHICSSLVGTCLAKVYPCFLQGMLTQESLGCWGGLGHVAIRLIYPKHSVYGVFTDIYPLNYPNLGK